MTLCPVCESSLLSCHGHSDLEKDLANELAKRDAEIKRLTTEHLVLSHDLAQQDAEIERLQRDLTELRAEFRRLREASRRADGEISLATARRYITILREDNARLREALEPFTKLKARWDDHGAFYKPSDVDPLIKAARAALAGGAA